VVPQYTQKCLRNLLYDKSASFRGDGRLIHSPGPAAANALSPKVLYVCVTTHVRLAVERSRRSRAEHRRQDGSGHSLLVQPSNATDMICLLCSFTPGLEHVCYTDLFFHSLLALSVLPLIKLTAYQLLCFYIFSVFWSHVVTVKLSCLTRVC